MIPKVIHYVWVGGGKKSKVIQRCMKSWKKRLPDYEIIEWNETNFDINSHPYVKAAYEARKWAYVSDYIRAFALFNYGGVYLDTDVLVIKKLDKFLNNRAFVGFETKQYPFTAAFGCEKEHPLVKKILDMYDNVEYSYDVKDPLKNVNTKTVSEILINDFNCVVNNRNQVIDEGIAVYDDKTLCNPSLHSYTVHVFTGTWLDNKKSHFNKILIFLRTRVNNPLWFFTYKMLDTLNAIRMRFKK